MKKTKVIILAMTSCLLWASVFPVVKTLFEELNVGGDTNAKIALAGMRFFTAGVLILITSFIMNKKKPIPESGNWFNIVLVGVFQTGGLYGAYYISLAFVTGVKAAVISQSGVFYMIIFALVLLGERLRREQVLGLIFGFLGILVLNMSGLTNSSSLFSFSLKGEGLLLLSGVFGSIGQILAKTRCSKVPAMTLNGWQMTIGGGLLLIVGTILNGGLVPLTSVLSLALMVYSIFVAAVAFTIWYYLLQNVNVNDIVPFRLTIPVFGSLFSAMVLPGETIGINIVFGLALVVAGMYVLGKDTRKKTGI